MNHLRTGQRVVTPNAGSPCPRAGGGIGPRREWPRGERLASNVRLGWPYTKNSNGHKQWTMIMAMILACVASEHESHLKCSACQESSSSLGAILRACEETASAFFGISQRLHNYDKYIAGLFKPVSAVLLSTLAFICCEGFFLTFWNVRMCSARCSNSTKAKRNTSMLGLRLVEFSERRDSDALLVVRNELKSPKCSGSNNAIQVAWRFVGSEILPPANCRYC